MISMTQDVIDELRKSVVRPFILCDIEFSDQVTHNWSGIGNLVIDSVTYSGVGNLGSISAISETSDTQANGVSISLTGVPSGVVGEALNYCRQGLPVTLSLGFMTEAGAVIEDPIILMRGHMDSASMDDGIDSCTLTITVEGRLSDGHRSRIRRFTDDDQQRTNPGDKGFQYVPLIQDWNLQWGGKIIFKF